MGICRATFFCLITLLFSCEELPIKEDKATTFIIAEGEHYAKPRKAATFSDNILSFRAMFDASAKYDLGDGSLQSNHNKLLGFSDCSSNHHDNSARFAWRWYNDELQIYAYAYVDGQRIDKYVGTVEIDEENHYEIHRTPEAYVFTLNGEQTARIERSEACADGVNYMLYPYFGGSAPAPHDVRVRVMIL